MKRILLIALLVMGPVTQAPADWRGALSAYENGNYAVALNEFATLARNGHPAAQNNLGVFYANGELVNKDPEMAAKWYLLAAEQGLAIAQVNVGYLYETGEGVEKDIGSALVWYQLAAEQGDDLAQFNIGRLKAEGIDGQRDDLNAYTWLTLAMAATKDTSIKKDALKVRKAVVKRMSARQIQEAKLLIAAWNKRH